MFEVECVLGNKVRTTKPYWNKIVKDKHPVMQNKDNEVQQTLKHADEVRKSKLDPSVTMYYKKMKKYYICVVVRNLNKEGFIITTYPTDKIKEGEIIWKKLK